MSVKKRIQLQLVSTFMFCIILIMLIGYKKMNYILLENRIQFYTESMKLQCQNTEYFRKLIENITGYSVNETNIAHSLSNNAFDSIITNSLSDLRSINLDIVGATIYSYSGLRYESNDLYNFPSFKIFSNSKEYKTFQISSQDSMWMLCTDDIPTYKYISSKSADVVSYIRKINYNNFPIGVVIVTISTSSFMKYFSYDSFNSNFSLSVYIPGNKINYEYGDKKITQPTENDVKALISSGKDYMMTKDKKHLIIAENLLDPNTYIIKTISLDNFYAQTYKLKISFILIAIILLMLLIFLYTRLSESIFTPLIALHDKMIMYRDQLK